MSIGKHISLEEARKQKKLERFAKEHPSEGDNMQLDAINHTENDAPMVIRVRHKRLNDYHTFTSEEVDGLYVFSKDAKVAVDDLCEAVQLLKWLNEKIDCTVTLTQSFYDFLKGVRGGSSDVEKIAKDGDNIN